MGVHFLKPRPKCLGRALQTLGRERAPEDGHDPGSHLGVNREIRRYIPRDPLTEQTHGRLAGPSPPQDHDDHAELGLGELGRALPDTGPQLADPEPSTAASGRLGKARWHQAGFAFCFSKTSRTMRS